MKKDIIKDLWNSMAIDNGTDGYYRPNDSGRQKDLDIIINNPEKAFPIIVYPLIKKYIGDLNGKKICVPSSGDNKAAYGFYLLGAKVTSCDISENQLKNAKVIADKYSWDIEFICQDSMKLEQIKDCEYDLVYTSNGVHVWIDDLHGMYKNINRILKPGGYSIFWDTHPMLRPFDTNSNKIDVIKIIKHYTDINSPADDGLPRYHWRTQDFINAIIESGFNIKHMEEIHPVDEDLDDYLPQEKNPEHENYGIDMKDWRQNPWAALPQCFCLCSQKQ
ncbi:MAG: class I SAM-dependent methyltransferase [Oscillospiraceae bacterium]|nr:class I SAM-dependent methyltransferase [Oscillospiraceae bacterium]